MISMKTRAPLAEVSAADPRGFSLGLSRAIPGPTGAQWFYEGTALGNRNLYVWFAENDIMITLQTDSQPPDGMDRISRGCDLRGRQAFYGVKDSIAVEEDGPGLSPRRQRQARHGCQGRGLSFSWWLPVCDRSGCLSFRSVHSTFETWRRRVRWSARTKRSRV
jgi:hypothetical protein